MLPDFNQLDLGDDFNIFYKECKEKYKFTVDINIKEQEDNKKKKSKYKFHKSITFICFFIRNSILKYKKQSSKELSNLEKDYEKIKDENILESK
jgi:hypothetical protein